MIIAGPNLSFDRMLAIEELRTGEVLGSSRAGMTPGGGGVNVARVVRDIGADALLVVLAPGRTGLAAVALLGDEKLVVRGVQVAGELASTAVIVERAGRVTTFDEPVPALAPGEWDRYERVIAGVLAGERVLVCTGALPPGAPENAFARLVGLADSLGVVSVVDASGPQLAAAVAAGADVVTPDLAEAEDVLGGRGETGVVGGVELVRKRALAAARALVGRGAERAVVTASRAGAAVAEAGSSRWVAAPAVCEVRSPLGAGDALAGGLALALERGEDFFAAVALGMACAAASVESATAGVTSLHRVQELLRGDTEAT
jgi:1-phosphofructokinase family hexose kinase